MPYQAQPTARNTRRCRLERLVAKKKSLICASVASQTRLMNAELTPRREERKLYVHVFEEHRVTEKTDVRRGVHVNGRVNGSSCGVTDLEWIQLPLQTELFFFFS